MFRIQRNIIPIRTWYLMNVLFTLRPREATHSFLPWSCHQYILRNTGSHVASPWLLSCRSRICCTPVSGCRFMCVYCLVHIVLYILSICRYYLLQSRDFFPGFSRCMEIVLLRRMSSFHVYMFTVMFTLHVGIFIIVWICCGVVVLWCVVLQSFNIRVVTIADYPSACNAGACRLILLR
jgi:hypothetical protein